MFFGSIYILSFHFKYYFNHHVQIRFVCKNYSGENIFDKKIV